MSRLLSFALLGALSLVCCDKHDELDAERGAAPPPMQSARPGLCRGGGGKPSDQVSAGFFPRTVAGYCIDPNGETRAYGRDAREVIDKVCLEQFNGECELYKSYGLERLVTLRYVDGGGSPGTVSINLSRFATVEGAYGFFTRRLIGGSDPAVRAPDELQAGAAGAIGAGSANVWRGKHVVELVYTNELEPGDQVERIARRVLPPLAAQIGKRLPGEMTLPPAARKLPKEHRLRMGVSYETLGALNISGVGGGALGYYRKGDRRWRVLCIVRPDEDSAKDVLKTFKRLQGAKTEKGVAFKALRFSLSVEDSAAKTQWVVARAGNTVFGVGDEEYVLAADRSAEEVEGLSLSREAKLEQLQRLLQAAEARGEARPGEQPGSGPGKGP